MKTLLLMLLLSSASVFAESAITDCDLNKTDEIVCGACNIYHESRGEGKEGMEAVAWVMINRKNDERFPANMCEIVWEQPYGRPEFSWTEDGLSDKVIDEDAWNASLEVATQYLSDTDSIELSDDPTMGALFYHNMSIEPSGWWNTLIVTNNIGSHRFYVDGE